MYKIPANTVFMGKNLVFVPECHSTNTLAHELSQQSAFMDGSVVITANQFAGRGQRGNIWESEPGKNLTLSIILKPSFLSVKDQFFLNIIASLAIHDLLSTKTVATISIKWPNDILLDSKKVCGILIENQISGQQVSKTIIGIGLNINQTSFSLPTATSLSLQTGHNFDLQEILEKLLSHLEARYLQLRRGELQNLREAYLQRLYLINTDHTFKSNNISFLGRITGIDSYGLLMIESAAGVQKFGFKEVAYI